MKQNNSNEENIDESNTENITNDDYENIDEFNANIKNVDNITLIDDNDQLSEDEEDKNIK